MSNEKLKKIYTKIDIKKQKIFLGTTLVSSEDKKIGLYDFILGEIESILARTDKDDIFNEDNLF